MTTFRNTQQFKFGRVGELLASERLQRDGMFVVPTGEIENGGAPKLLGLMKKEILPDFQAFRKGEKYWVEIKTKNACTYHRKTDNWEQGIELRLWNSYQEVVSETEIPGALVILCNGCGVMHARNFESLKPASRIAEKVPGYPGHPNGLDMIYFQCNQFRWISLTDLERNKLTPWEISAIVQTEICHYGDKFSEDLRFE